MNGDGFLFDYDHEDGPDPTPHARAGDLDTSHEAAAKTPSYEITGLWITWALSRRSPITDDDIFNDAVANGYEMTPNSLRGARHYLWEKGAVSLFDKTGASNRGNRSARWCLRTHLEAMIRDGTIHSIGEAKLHMTTASVYVTETGEPAETAWERAVPNAGESVGIPLAKHA